MLKSLGSGFIWFRRSRKSCSNAYRAPLAVFQVDYLVSHERLGPLAYRQFQRSAAARGVGLESQHGELAVGLALVVGSNKIFDIFGHYVVCMNQQACRTPKKLLVSEEGAGSAQQFRLVNSLHFHRGDFPAFEEGIDFLSQVMSVDQH